MDDQEYDPTDVTNFNAGSDIASSLFSRYQQQAAPLNALQIVNLDKVTKMLSNNVPSPRTMMDIAQQSINPISGYEIMRGDRRPTTGEVMRAAEGSDLKYALGVGSLINQGTDNAAHEMQLVINAMNAQIAAGNTQIAPVTNVMKAILPTLDPTDAVLFSRAYLSAMGSDPHPTDQSAWARAGEILQKGDFKAKVPAMKVYNSQGDLVQVDPSSGDATKIYQAPQKPSSANKGFTPIFSETPIYDQSGQQIGVQRSPVGSFDRTTGQYVGGGQGGPVGQNIKVTPPPTGFKRTQSGLAPIQGGPADPNVKQTPKEAEDLSAISTSMGAADQLKSRLMPNGSVDSTAVRKMASGVFGGGELKALFQQAASGIRHTLYGSALTENEVKNFTEGFMPGFTDSDATVKQKLNGLSKLLENDYNARSTARTPNSTQSKSDNNNNSILDKARAAIANGAPRDAVLQRLKSAGIDASGL